MRRAVSILFGAAAFLATFVGFSTLPVSAQDDPRLDDLEEQVLRTQVEIYLNEFAKWDGDQKRVVISRRDGSRGEGRGGRPSDLGGLEPVAEFVLQKTVEADDNGRLRIKEEVHLRPFAKVAQDFIAEGGVEDIEKFQRFRNGDGENPFKQGIPPRVQKAVTGFLKALNDQTLNAGKPKAKPDDGDDDEARPEERRARAEAEREKAKAQRAKAEMELRRKAERAEEKARADEERKIAARQRSEERRRNLKTWLGDRFEMEPEEMEQLERYMRELGDQAEKDMERMREEMRARLDEFGRSERGQELRERSMRLRRRAEDELRRALESDDVKARLEDAQKRAMEFMVSPEGQEMQRRILEFLESENGKELRRRLDEFLGSERGRELLKGLADRFRGGGTPDRPQERQRADELRKQSDADKRRAEEQLRKAVEEKRREEERARREQERPRRERQLF